ncbi:hypothetical protein BGX29_010340, partial [Mortierella sp. GBA35]
KRQSLLKLNVALLLTLSTMTLVLGAPVDPSVPGPQTGQEVDQRHENESDYRGFVDLVLILDRLPDILEHTLDRILHRMGRILEHILDLRGLKLLESLEDIEDPFKS